MTPARDSVSASHALELQVRAVRMQRLLNHLPALVAFWDKDLKNVIANDEYVKWFGRTPDQIHGTHIRDVLGEHVYTQNLSFIRGALAGEEQHFDRTLVDPTGRVRHSQAAYIPEIVDGEVLGFFVLVTDITNRVEAERELDDAQALARTGSWVYYPKTQQMTWSRELFCIIGRDPDKDLASIDTYLAAVDPEDRPILMRQQAAAPSLTDTYELRYRIRLDGGAVRHVHSRGRPEVNADGEVTRITGTVQDETELQEATRQLSDMNRQLANANSLLSDTLAMISHDIRQPIQSVTGFLELIQTAWDTAPSKQLQEYLQRAGDAAQRMNTLVDDILMLVTIDDGALTIRPSAVSVAALVEEVVRDLPPGIEVELQLDRDATVSADPFHLRQVLANLLANAIRYGRPPFVMSSSGETDRIQIHVIDHGDGVPIDFVPRLFDRFSRATTGVAATRPGSGFGLYIARQLVVANHGDIAYESLEPNGSRFTVTLPRTKLEPR